MGSGESASEVSLEDGEGAKCPRCGGGSFGECRYDGDAGGPLKFLDRYTAACRGCGHVLTALVSGGDVGQSEWVTHCPFCGVQHHSHRKRGQP